MNSLASHTGIDVSKLSLTISIKQQKPFDVLNKEQHIKSLIEKFEPGTVVHLESSGGYERLVQRLLTQAGIDVRVHNPLKARRIAQAMCKKAKTDSVDAMMLAEQGPLLPTQTTKSTERQGLADLSRAIESLKHQIRELKQKSALDELDKDAKQLYHETIQDLQRRVKQAEDLFVKRVKTSSFDSRYKLIMSVPGVGPVTARICLCEFPEDIEQRSPEQISCYAGLAPIDNQSGNKFMPSKIARGNSRLKAAFYMPALAVTQSQKWAKDLYAKLRDKGKSHQTAIIAVMRRLIVRVVAVVKRGSPWQGEPPKH